MNETIVVVALLAAVATIIIGISLSPLFRKEPRAANFRVKAYLEPADIPVGHEAKVTVMVLNRGDLTGTSRIGVRARMGTRVEAVGEGAVTLDGGQEKTLVFMFKPSQVR